MALRLKTRSMASAPLEVEGVVPDRVAGMSVAEIGELLVHHGNRKGQLSDFFEVEGDASDGVMHWVGDLRGVHWLGAGMRSGEIVVEGSVGRHLGSEMEGGTIRVHGDAGDWVGAEMTGGSIRVQGNAGHLVGSAYRGSARGMSGGQILVDGSAGNEIGHTMRRGLIAVGGDSGDLAGFNMLAGTIILGGDTGIRHGAGMRRGTLAFLGKPPEMLPTFRLACRFQPEAMTLVLGQLAKEDFPLTSECLDAEYDLYNGDLLEGGRGEVLLRVRGGATDE